MYTPGLFFFVILLICSFLLGGVPFSLLIGKWLLGKDVRDYGDGNPGAANVFRAGNLVTGILALVLDITKAMPFVLVAQLLMDLSGIYAAVIALAAILGHAFSPLLGWRGGKALAVSLGALLSLGLIYYAVVYLLCLFIFLALLQKQLFNRLLLGPLFEP